MVRIDQKEVIEIAAHLLGRRHGGKEFELRPVGKGRKNHRQHVDLDVRRQLEFLIQPVQFRHHGHDALHRISGLFFFRDCLKESDHIFIACPHAAARCNTELSVRVLLMIFVDRLVHQGGQILHGRAAVRVGEHEKARRFCPDHIPLFMEGAAQDFKSCLPVSVRFQDEGALYILFADQGHVIQIGQITPVVEP